MLHCRGMQEAIWHHYKRRLKKRSARVYTWWVWGIDWVIYPVGVIGLLMAIPQIYKIWAGHSAAGVSVLSWTAWSLISIFWTLYGLVHRAKPIIFLNAAWVVMNALVAISALLYSRG